MRTRLSVPSKTFLIGEYAVLDGGPCLVAGHEPRFSLLVDGFRHGQCEGIHPASPAGQFIRQHKEAFQRVGCSFSDPHHQRGGLGASSAQFVLAYAWAYLQNHRFVDLARGVDGWDLWQSYRHLEHGSARLPSGADVVAQSLGRVTTFRADPFLAKAADWPFLDLSFVLLRTGKKVATHTHLREQNLLIPGELKAISQAAVEAFQQVKANEFVASVQSFAQILRRSGLEAVHTFEIVDKMEKTSGVLGVKGCGAMGADVVFVLCRPESLAGVIRAVQSFGLEVVGTSADLSEGLRVEVTLEPRQTLGPEMGLA